MPEWTSEEIEILERIYAETRGEDGKPNKVSKQQTKKQRFARELSRHSPSACFRMYQSLRTHTQFRDETTPWSLEVWERAIHAIGELHTQGEALCWEYVQDRVEICSSHTCRRRILALQQSHPGWLDTYLQGGTAFPTDVAFFHQRKKDRIHRVFPWTQADSELLFAMRRQGVPWDEIHARFPNRTRDSLYVRYGRLSKKATSSTS